MVVGERPTLNRRKNYCQLINKLRLSITGNIKQSPQFKCRRIKVIINYSVGMK